jgi:hypothetical protein
LGNEGKGERGGEKEKEKVKERKLANEGAEG